MRSILTLAALVAAAVPLTGATAQTMRGYTAVSTRLYSGPLRDYPTVRTVRRGTTVNVHGCLRDWTWCDVTYRANRGWIAGEALRIQYNGRRRGIGANMGVGIISFAFGSYWDNNYRGRPFYGQRQRWQSQYDNAYRPEWGEREQRRDWDSDRNRGRRHDRRRTEGQHGQDRRGDNRQIEEQQRRTRAADDRRGAPDMSRYSAEPYRFPDHGSSAAQPNRLTEPSAGPNNYNGGSARSAQSPEQTTAEAARQPQH